MPSASMNRLMDDARVRLPGALDGTIQSELFAVVRKFCEDTNVWKMPFDIEREVATERVMLTPDAYTYEIIPPTGSRVVRLLGVVDQNAFPVHATMMRPNFVTFRYSPNAPDTVVAWVALTVADPITRKGEPVVPDWIVESYNDTLLNGVMFRMMSQVAKPYSNLQLGVAHGQFFKQGISQARAESDRGRVQGAQMWTYPRSFATHRR